MAMANGTVQLIQKRANDDDDEEEEEEEEAHTETILRKKVHSTINSSVTKINY